MHVVHGAKKLHMFSSEGGGAKSWESKRLLVLYMLRQHVLNAWSKK